MRLRRAVVAFAILAAVLTALFVALSGCGGGDSPTLLTDEEAAEYFGVPATHEGPSDVGALVNVTYTPTDKTGQMIITSTLNKDSLDNFEAQIRDEAKTLGIEPEKLEGLGESAYFTASAVRFFKDGATYQVTASEPKNGQDLKTVLISFAQKMASRVP